MTSLRSPLLLLRLPESTSLWEGPSPLRRSLVNSSWSSSTCRRSRAASPPLSKPVSRDMERLRRFAGPRPREGPVFTNSSRIESWRITAAWGRSSTVRGWVHVHTWSIGWKTTCKAWSCALRPTSRWQTSCVKDKHCQEMLTFQGSNSFKWSSPALRSDPAVGSHFCPWNKKQNFSHKWSDQLSDSQRRYTEIKEEME